MRLLSWHGVNTQKLIGVKMGNSWIFRNRANLVVVLAVIFGIIWMIDGSFKFMPGTADTVVQSIQSAGQSLPALAPWFSLWYGMAIQNPIFWVELIGTLEILLGIALVLGFMKKTTYVLGMVLSLFIWAVPEAFGGPYGSGSTDIGTGIIYAIVFAALILINAGYGPSRLSVDYCLEKRVSWWRKVAEFSPAGSAKGKTQKQH